MQIREILTLDCTKSAVQCTSKKQALEMISEIAADHSGQSSTELFEDMLSREKLGSTGIGNGIAIPHARMKSDKQAIAVLLQCESPIEFDAVDHQPVDLLFALLVPEAQSEEGLEALSQMAITLNDKGVIKQLRDARSDKELFDVMIFQ